MSRKVIHRHRHSYYPVLLAGHRIGSRLAAALAAEADRLGVSTTDVLRDALEKRLGVPAADEPRSASGA